MVRRRSLPRAMADLREGLLAPRGAFEGDDDDSALDDPNGDDATRAMGAPWTAAATATISLTMTAVGSVVLSLPATFAECGWLAGTCVLALVALLVDASLLFVVYAARSARARSYEEAARALLGPTGGACVEVALIALVYGSLVSLQIIVADQVQPVVLGVLENCSSHDDEVFGFAFVGERWFVTCVSLAFVYPMTLARSLAALASATTAAFFVLLFVSGALVSELAKKDWIPAPDVVAVETSRGATPCALALPVVAMAYACHFNVVAVDRELPPTRRGKACAANVIHASVLLGAFPFYVLFAMVGYIQFGADVSGDVLTEWRGGNENGVMTAAQLAVAGVNALKYPLMGFSLKRAVNERLARLWHPTRRADRREDEEAGHLEREDEGTADVHDDDDEPGGGNRQIQRRGTRGPAVRAVPLPPSAAPFWAEATAGFVLHASVATCALSAGSLQLAVDLVGSCCGVPVMLVVPGLMFLAAFERGDASGAWVGEVRDDESSEGAEGADDDDDDRRAGDDGAHVDPAREYFGEGLEWAARWKRDARGRLVARPRAVMAALAWTLVGVGSVVAATGLAGIAHELASGTAPAR